MGRLVPAGTGLSGYSKLSSVVDPELLEENDEYEMTIEDREGPLCRIFQGLRLTSNLYSGPLRRAGSFFGNHANFSLGLALYGSTRICFKSCAGSKGGRL